jgi:hypothetical protein
MKHWEWGVGKAGSIGIRPSCPMKIAHSRGSWHVGLQHDTETQRWKLNVENESFELRGLNCTSSISPRVTVYGSSLLVNLSKFQASYLEKQIILSQRASYHKCGDLECPVPSQFSANGKAELQVQKPVPS